MFVCSFVSLFVSFDQLVFGMPARPGEKLFRAFFCLGGVGGQFVMR